MIDLMTDKGVRLSELSEENKLFMVFLRHFGCTFCRETLAEIKKKRDDIEQHGVKIVFVHMMSEAYAREVFKVYGMDDIDHISDPARRLYKEFGLEQGTLRQVLGLKVWLKFILTGLFKGHLVGPLRGNGYQMPGVFIYHKQKVIKSYIHEYTSDKPDYIKLSCCVQR